MIAPFISLDNVRLPSTCDPAAFRARCSRLMKAGVPQGEALAGAVDAAMMASVRATASAFPSMRCPTCGAGPASFAAASKEFTCARGHVSVNGKPKDPSASQAVARRPSPAAPSASPKVKPLPWMTAEVPLHGYISAGGPISSRGVAMTLANAKAGNARALLVNLDSRGGAAPEGLLVAGALRQFKGHVVAYVPRGGSADSAASGVLLAADFIVIAPSASITIHRATGGDTSIANSAAVHTGLFASTYEERTLLGTYSACKGLLEAWGDTTLSAADALEYGFADEVGDENRARDVAHKLAAAWPCWPANVWSPRRDVLQMRADRARRQGSEA